MKTIEKIIGERIRERRKRLNWTQTELAKRARVGLQTVLRIEKGRQLPQKANLSAIAEALKCTTDELYGELTKPTQTMESLLEIVKEQDKKISELQATIDRQSEVIAQQADDLEAMKILRDSGELPSVNELAERVAQLESKLNLSINAIRPKKART